MSILKNKKVALVYDRVNKWGGAERVLLALHKLFPEAPLYTTVYNGKKAVWADVFSIKTSYLQKIPFASTNHELLPLFTPVAFESFNFNEFDIIISITSESAKGIITKPSTLHICYCLTPTRYLWSGYKDYFNNSFFKTFSNPAVSYLRHWDLIAAQRPDAYIAISKEVQGRIKKYYGRESEVVYPPVTIPKINPLIEEQNSESGPKVNNYYLIVSRLVPYKRIDVPIMTCNELKLPLVIIGKGSDEKRLRSLAGPTVKFTGFVADEELVKYYMNCKALIFPGREDFGLTMVEAQSFGKPVLAFKAGGALEIVIENETGSFFNKQTVENLKKAMTDFNNKSFSKSDCLKQADKFNIERFENNFVRIVESLL